jgi:hypothetical protein
MVHADRLTTRLSARKEGSMTNDPTLEGGCLCGAIRYRIAGAPHHVSHCHCTMCRRASGAAMVTWATVPADSFEITKGEPRWYQSSDHGKRGFCPGCGTPILFSSTHYAGWVDVTAGSLDRPEQVRPTNHTYEPSRIPWLTMSDGLPRHIEDSRSPLV